MDTDGEKKQSKKKGFDIEQSTEDIVVVSTTNDCCQRLTDHVTCTGIGQCSTQSQCADKEHQHIPRNIAESRLLIDYAVQFFLFFVD